MDGRLNQLVTEHGIHIEWDARQTERGRAYLSARTIVLKTGMTEALTRSVAMHELAHIVLEHDCGSASAEAEAWQWAAEYLIDSMDYAEAEAMHPSAGAIAHELGVSVEVVEAYRHKLSKGATRSGKQCAIIA